MHFFASLVLQIFNQSRDGPFEFGFVTISTTSPFDKVDVIAEAVALNNEDGKIGFKIIEEDWQKISRKEYETADGITYGAKYIIVSSS